MARRRGVLPEEVQSFSRLFKGGSRSAGPVGSEEPTRWPPVLLRLNRRRTCPRGRGLTRESAYRPEACTRHRYRPRLHQMRLPDALGEPHAARFHFKTLAKVACEFLDLAGFVGIRQRGKNRLIIAARQKFQPSLFHLLGHALEVLRDGAFPATPTGCRSYACSSGSPV